LKTGIFYILSILLFLTSETSVFSQESVRAKIVAKVADNLIDAKAVAQNNEATIKDDYSYIVFIKKGRTRKLFQKQPIWSIFFGDG